MPAISKELFYEKVALKTCKDFYHQDYDSCIQGCLHFLPDVFKGTAKFYLVIYTAQTLLNWKLISVDYFKKLLLSYGRSILYGLCMGTLITSTICLSCNLCNGLWYYNVGLISGCIGGLGIFVESQQNRYLDSLIFISSAVEAFLRYLNLKNIMRITVFNTTALFMAFNACLMYLLSVRKNKSSIYWFYIPKAEKVSSEINKTCQHTAECWKFALKGFSKYFLIGFTINLAKMLLSSFKILLKPSKLLDALFNRNHFLFGLFLGSYVGILRITSCLFKKLHKTSKWWHSIVSGLISGIPFCFKPKMQLLTLLITNVGQLSAEKLIQPGSQLAKLPTMELLMCLSFGYLLHFRLVKVDCCPKFFKKMAGTTTDGFVDRIYDSILQTVGLA